MSAAFDTITHFEKKSGFLINYEKTTLYRFSSIKKTQVKYFTRKQVTWTNDGINILGVEVNTDKQKMLEKNYDPLLLKSNLILKSWGNRGLSLLGKISVINTLIASLYVYKMSVLLILPEKYVKSFNSMCEKFLWNNRKPKISLEILQKNTQDGGAGLVNIKLKDLSLKAGWVSIIKTDQLLTVFAYRKLAPQIKELI